MIHKSTKIITGLSLAFFVCCTILSVIFIHKVYAEKAEYAAKHLEHLEMRERERSIDTLTHALQNTAEERATLSERILKEEEVVDFLALIEDIGREQGTVLITRGLTVEPINETFETLVVTVNAEGSYDAVTHLMVLLEHLPYQTILDKIRLSREGQGGAWSTSFEMRVTKFKKV